MFSPWTFYLLALSPILAIPQGKEPENPWTPKRDVAPPSTQGTPVPKDSFDSYHFAVRDFLIALGVVFLVIGLLIGVLVTFRMCKKKRLGGGGADLLFEKESAALAVRSNSVRDPRRGAAGMRGDLGPMSKASS
jgi:hypothetical protein